MIPMRNCSGICSDRKMKIIVKFIQMKFMLSKLCLQTLGENYIRFPYSPEKVHGNYPGHLKSSLYAQAFGFLCLTVLLTAIPDTYSSLKMGRQPICSLLSL